MEISKVPLNSLDGKVPVDIKTLIQTSNIQIYDQNKLIDKLRENFTEEEQKLYVANLFLYLNYHPTNDYIVNLENVWKFIGFSNKGNAKRLLKQHFIENNDYKKLLIRTDEQKNKDDSKTVIRSDDGKFASEKIMLNINTFKKLCLRANTDNADKIHDYYIKLEMVYNELTKEQLQEQQKLIEEQKDLVKEKEELLLEKNKKLEFYEKKPSTHGFTARRKGFVYMIKERSKPGHYKIGMSYDVDKRLRNLNIGSSEASLKIYNEIQTYDCEMLETMIHKILKPFNITGRREWFFFDNNEINYALHVLHVTNEFLNKFNFSSSLDINEYMKCVKTVFPSEKSNEHQKEQVTETNMFKLTRQQSTNRTGNYKGVCWCKEKEKWKAELKIAYKNNFLGYYDIELEAAKAYNDYALYINNEKDANYLINDIPDYQANPRNIPEEKTCLYNGVSYDSKRKYYVVSIKYKGKSYNLGNDSSELECAKIYNKQALYFNNTYNTNYILNDIPDYQTIPENIYDNLQKNKITKKSSKYCGVTFTKTTNKWRALLVYNKKQNHLGFYDNELDAAKAYNAKALELNKEFNCKYKINDFS